MTRLLEQAVEAVSAMPADVQDEFARVLLRLAGVEQPPIALTPGEDADLAEAEARDRARRNGDGRGGPRHVGEV